MKTNHVPPIAHRHVKVTRVEKRGNPQTKANGWSAQAVVMTLEDGRQVETTLCFATPQALEAWMAAQGRLSTTFLAQEYIRTSVTQTNRPTPT